jgi:DNA-binding transcriptional MerR regulator
MNSGKYTIDQLVEMSGYSRRAIRYYIQENLLDPPAGRGRGGFYNDSHLAHLQKIRSLQSQGMSLMAIKRLRESGNVREILPAREVWAKYNIAPGIDINVRRDLEASSGKKLDELIKFAISVMKEETQDE